MAVSKVLVLEIQVRLLRELVETAIGARQRYRVVTLATGDILDLDTAEGVMDHLFTAGGLDGLKHVAVYKDRRKVPLPRGGEVSELARWLEALWSK